MRSPGRVSPIGVVGVLAAGVLAAAVSSVAPVEASVRSQVLYARGLVPYHEGRWEQAYALFDAAVAADEADALALYYRGLTHARRGSNLPAIDDLRAALQIEPRLPNAPLDLGVALFNEGRFADAQRALRVALDRGTHPEVASFFLGMCAYRLGDYAEARARLDDAGRDPSLRQSASYYAGLAELRAGDEDSARARMRRAAEVDPDSEIGRQATRFAAGAAMPAPVPGDLLEPAWDAYAETRIEVDSNVVAGASDGVDGTGDELDGRPVLRAGGSYRMPTAGSGVFTARADLGQSVHFSTREFDLTTVRLAGDWASTRSGRWSFGGGAGYGFHALDYGAFSQAFSVQPWAAFHATEATATQGYYRFRYRDYLDNPFDPFRDGFNNAVGVRQYWAPRAAWVAHVGYQFDAESPEDTNDGDPFLAAGAEDFEYLGHQLDSGVALPWQIPGIGPGQVRGGYRLRFEDFSNPNSRSRAADGSGGKRRHDVEHTLALHLDGTIDSEATLLDGLVRRIRVSIGLIAHVGGSNIDAFEYDRVIGSLGLHADL